MADEKHRYFFGIDLPESVKEGLWEWYSFLDRERNARIVKPENLHVTIGFLGHLREQEVASILEEYKRLVSKQEIRAFNITLEGWGVFPPGRLPRVLWVGISSGVDNLSRLHDLLREATRSAGIKTHLDEERRSFSPHVTVARFYGMNLREWLKTKNILDSKDTIFGDVLVDRVVLKCSILSREGPTYIDEGFVDLV